MRIRLICIGKPHAREIKSMMEDFESRIKNYVNFEIECFSVKVKRGKQIDILLKEMELILRYNKPSTVLMLLDEKGQSMTSKAFAIFLQDLFNRGVKEINFVIGGAYGFHDELYKMAHYKVALSKMTFTHQMCRLIFVEQLYRGLSILKGEKYHHD